MNLSHQNIIMLDQISDLLAGLPPNLYIKKQPLIDNSTIGQHIRHILEFYQCIMQALSGNRISYDARKRDHQLETELLYALETIQELKVKIGLLDQERQIELCASYSEDEKEKEYISSSVKRELAYTLDHTIHHLAIVKIVLSTEGVKVVPSLGIAPSTLRFRHKPEYTN